MITSTTVKSPSNEIGVRITIQRGLLELIIEAYEAQVDVYAGIPVSGEFFYMETATRTKKSPSNWTTEIVGFYASLSNEVIVRELAQEFKS